MEQSRLRLRQAKGDSLQKWKQFQSLKSSSFSATTIQGMRGFWRMPEKTIYFPELLLSHERSGILFVLPLATCQLRRFVESSTNSISIELSFLMMVWESLPVFRERHILCSAATAIANLTFWGHPFVYCPSLSLIYYAIGKLSSQLLIFGLWTETDFGSILIIWWGIELRSRDEV